MGKFRDLTGMKFGRLTVINRNGANKNGNALWKCKCDCGNIVKQANGYHLVTGQKKSCGCIYSGLYRSPLRGVYDSMKKRCNNANDEAYHNYGGRGIRVCLVWSDSFLEFYNWANINGYQKGLTLDREDVNGDYCPENCRWVTWDTQQNNRRDNITVFYGGSKYTVKQLSEMTGLKEATVRQRIRAGWGESELLQPVNKSGGNVKERFKHPGPPVKITGGR